MTERFEAIWDLIPDPAEVDPAALRGGVSADWTTEFDEPTWAGPVLGDDGLFVATERGGVHSLDPDTGDVAWSTSVGGAVRVRPALGDGQVYVRRNGRDPGVTALDATSGDPRWHATLPVDGDPSFAALGTGPGHVYVGGTGTAVRALDAADGDERWVFETAGQVRSAPVRVDDVVVFGSDDGHVYAVDANGGEERWRFQAGEWIAGSPTVEDGHVYVGSADRTDDGRSFGRIWALDADTGDPTWVFDTDGHVHAAPTATDGRVIAADGRGLLYGVDAETGEGNWAVHVGGTLSPPVTGQGSVYVGSDSAETRAIDAGNGHRRWVHEGDGTDVVPDPAARSGTIYTYDRRGTVFALSGDGDE